MRVLFLTDYTLIKSGIGREYLEGFIQDFDKSIWIDLVNAGIVDEAPEKLKTICVLSYNSKIKKEKESSR